MLSNLIIESLLSLTSSSLLLLGGHISDSDLLLHDPNTRAFGSCGCNVFQLHFLNVCEELSLFLLANFFILHALLLTGLDLVDEDLSTTSTGFSGTILPLELSFDGFQTLDFHHHIKSLLLGDPVLFELIVFLLLTLANGPDLRCLGHLVHVLHIVVILVHLLLSTGEESVLTIASHFDVNGCVSLPLSVLLLHALLASDCNSHLRLPGLFLNHPFTSDHGRTLNNSVALHPSQGSAVDNLDLGLVLLVAVNLLSDVFELKGGDHRSVVTHDVPLLIRV